MGPFPPCAARTVSQSYLSALEHQTVYGNTMSSRRTEKVSQAVLECISSSILLHLKDPRVKNVTVLSVEVTSDYRSAKVNVSILGDEKTQALTLRGLQSARGFLQAKVAERLETRYTPVLKFVVDRGVKQSIEASTILRDIMKDENRSENSDVEVTDENGSSLDETPPEQENVSHDVGE